MTSLTYYKYYYTYKDNVCVLNASEDAWRKEVIEPFDNRNFEVERGLSNGQAVYIDRAGVAHTKVYEGLIDFSKVVLLD